MSTLSVSIDGEPLRVLTSRVVDYYSARVFGTLATARMGLNPPVSIQRDRIVSDGVHWRTCWICAHEGAIDSKPS